MQQGSVSIKETIVTFNFKQKFIIPTLVLIVIGMASTSVISYRKSKNALQENIIHEISGIAGGTAFTMDSWSEDRSREVQIWGEFDFLKTALVESFSGKAARKKASELFAGWVNSYDYYESICLADSTGMVIASSDRSSIGKINIGDRKYFKQAVKGEPAISEILTSKSTGDTVFILATQVKRKGKTLPGVLFAVVKISAFSSRYTDTVTVGSKGLAYIVDAKGLVVAHPDKAMIGKADIGDLDYGKTILGSDKGTIDAQINGNRAIAAFKKSARTGCTIVVQAQADEIFAPVAAIARFSFFLVLAVTIVAGLIIYFIAVTVASPINRVVDGLKDAAEGEGDLTKRLEITSSDEIGMLGKWFNLFVERVQAIIRDVAGNSKKLTDASISLSEISVELTREAKDASAKTGSVAASAEQMSCNMDTVAAAMEQASNNIHMVSSSAEELTATIGEIAANSERGRVMASEAVIKTDEASGSVRELGKAASEIDKVVETITDISDQVNLLALNATIEAARAGEAGKGFAVVANEIKELARQTAQATGEIKTKVLGIQESTGGTIAQITDINGIVKDVSDIVTTIAAAVEEQSIATREIAQNVSQAATGVNDVTENVSQSSSTASHISHEIVDISKSSDKIAHSSTQVNLRADELAKLAGSLDAMVGKFVV